MKRFLSQNYPTLTVVAAILYLSLAKISVDEEIPRLIPHLDKIAHCLMYLGLVSVFCFDKYRRPGADIKRGKMLLQGWILAILLGGAMELAQPLLTDYRSGDWSDMAANVAGATLGLLSGRYLAKPIADRIGRYF